MLASALVGALGGSLVEKEIALFEWRRDRHGGWYLMKPPERSTGPQIGWSPA
jgi:hypothetical protein